VLQKLLVFLIPKTQELLPTPNNRFSVRKFFSLRDIGRSLRYSK